MSTPEITESNVRGEEAERVARAGELSRVAARVASELGRPDLASRATVAASRVTRPSVVVCVVGEFKQGKSALVNALVGSAVCPVDDDLATSTVTLVHHAEVPQVVVRERGDGELVARAVEPVQIGEYASEAGNPDNTRRIERVEIGLPVPLLSEGLTLVDTPGLGGLSSGTTAATLGFLPWADALIFASDASAELSAPELEFLTEAAAACPNVIFCLTKIDIYPEWRRIAELDAAHLRAAGVESPVMAVSSMVRTLGLRRSDETLDAESGIPSLIDVLHADVFGPAKRIAAARAAAEATNVSGQLLDGSRTERLALDDDRAFTGLLADLEAARTRLQKLQGAGARWHQVLNDRMTDLSSGVNHRFREGLRAVNRAAEDDVENLRNTEQWEAIAQQLQRGSTEVVAETFRKLESDAAGVAAEIASLVEEDTRGIAGEGDALAVDFDAMWHKRSLTTGAGSLAGRTVNETLTVLRGAQGGILMLGMAGGLMPAAAAGVLLSMPVTLSLGALFAGHAMVEHRKRKVAVLQQQARAAARQFLDEVQFQVGDELAEQIRVLHREIRDHFSARIAELLRTQTDAAQRLQENAHRSELERTQRRDALDAQIPALESLHEAARAIGGEP